MDLHGRGFPDRIVLEPLRFHTLVPQQSKTCVFHKTWPWLFSISLYLFFSLLAVASAAAPLEAAVLDTYIFVYTSTIEDDTLQLFGTIMDCMRLTFNHRLNRARSTKSIVGRPRMNVNKGHTKASTM